MTAPWEQLSTYWYVSGDFEVSGVIDRGTYINRAYPNEEPEFWSVYRLNDMGYEVWQSDHSTFEDALAAAELLRNQEES